MSDNEDLCPRRTASTLPLRRLDCDATLAECVDLFDCIKVTTKYMRERWTLTLWTECMMRVDLLAALVGLSSSSRSADSVSCELSWPGDHNFYLFHFFLFIHTCFELCTYSMYLKANLFYWKLYHQSPRDRLCLVWGSVSCILYKCYFWQYLNLFYSSIFT